MDTNIIPKSSIIPDNIQLDDILVVNNTHYRVEAVYRYQDAEDRDDYWFDFSAVSNNGSWIYIGAEQDNSYQWEYTIWDVIPDYITNEHPHMCDITYDDHRASISYEGITYKLYDVDEMLYEAHVESYVTDGQKGRYPVWISDMEDNSGENYLSIEVDDDNEVEVSLGSYLPDLKLIKGSAREEKPRGFFQKLFGR